MILRRDGNRFVDATWEMKLHITNQSINVIILFYGTECQLDGTTWIHTAANEPSVLLSRKRRIDLYDHRDHSRTLWGVWILSSSRVLGISRAFLIT